MPGSGLTVVACFEPAGSARDLLYGHSASKVWHGRQLADIKCWFQVLPDHHHVDQSRHNNSPHMQFLATPPASRPGSGSAKRLISWNTLWNPPLPALSWVKCS